MNNKPITLTIVALGITIVALLLFGCATSEPKSDIRLHDLLHKDCNYVYKSITIKDYIIKEEC